MCGKHGNAAQSNSSSHYVWYKLLLRMQSHCTNQNDGNFIKWSITVRLNLNTTDGSNMLEMQDISHKWACLGAMSSSRDIATIDASFTA